MSYEKCLGLIKKAYERLDNLKAKVLKDSRSDLKENASLTFDYELISRGKKYDSIFFALKDHLER